MIHILPIALSALSSAPSAHAIPGGTPLDFSRPGALTTVAISTPETKALCSGVLITGNAVLTSAQCVYKQNPRKLFITFGLEAGASTIYRGVTQTYVPKQYVPYLDQLPGFKNAWDIALVFFTGSLPKPYQPAQLVKGGVLTAQEFVEIAGYGSADSFGSGAGLLRGCSATIADPKFSGSEFQLASNELCGVSPRDAGGPVYRVVDSRVFIYGLNAWGYRDDDLRARYSVHTKISTYYPWIQAILFNP